MFDADTVGAAEFHDYPTLAVDADGLYICTNDFNAGGDESCYSIPKADLWPEGIDELESFEYSVTDSGNVKTGAPGGCHDDCCIALALAVWHPGQRREVKDVDRLVRALSGRLRPGRRPRQGPDWFSRR